MPGVSSLGRGSYRQLGQGGGEGATDIGSDEEMDSALVAPAGEEAPAHAALRPWRTLLALWAMSFWLNCKPSEPYLAKYLLESKDLSEDQLNHEVWPWSTYGALLFMLPVGLLAETAGYRRVIVGGLVCRELTRVLLVFATGVFWMATMQLTYAGSVAANSI